ncbi:unnamed protein product [Adineta ricciae]|nr:unnamed protein product [Adineta ricciae]
MDIEIEDALELASENYHCRLLKKSEKARFSRSRTQYSDLISSQSVESSSSFPFDTTQAAVLLQVKHHVVSEIEHDLLSGDVDEYSRTMPDTDDMNELSTSSSNDYSSESSEENGLISSVQLHQYTDLPTGVFCRKLLQTFRHSRISKIERDRFLKLFHEVLPIPNNLPSSMNKVHSLLQFEENLFRKKQICLECTQDIPVDSCSCHRCPNSDETNIAVVYQSDIKVVLSLVLKSLCNEIHDYKKQLRANRDDLATNDIGFGYAYQQLLQQYSSENFITALMHLDGVSLCESNKLKMWLFSFSIVELPSKLRYQRHNMPVLSMWISTKEPIASVWLQDSVAVLEELKTTGVVVNANVVKLKVIGVIGDSPALKIALNFVAHNGYYCCYFCLLHGVHQNGKRQYPYECPFRMRTAESFARDSSTASQFKRNENGHLGVSVIADVVDIQLPYSIIVDYAHASLLRHAKSIFNEIYRRLTPATRDIVDVALAKQPFPHFFNRRMKALKDLSFVKATEVRNILFYGFLPVFHQHLPVDLLSHFALYIVGMRLFHGRPIFADATAKIANELIMTYYKDFRSFYHGLENFVLHIHAHFEAQYRMYGSFSHLGSFGQEGLMGYMGSNFTGTRYQGDLIAENYSLDIALRHTIKDSKSLTKISDGPFDKDVNFDFTSNGIFLDIHNRQCNCMSISSCLTAFRRCSINNRIYHSILYKRRQKSVSYYVRYCRSIDNNAYSFGKIIMFFQVQSFTYAVIRQHPIHCLFSDLISSSSSYDKLLRKPINHLFYVVSKEWLPTYELVLVSRIFDHCIVFDCIDYHIVTPISSYDEHD